MKILKTISTPAKHKASIQFVSQAGRNFRIHYQPISFEMTGYDIYRYKADLFNEQTGWVFFAGEEDIAFKRVLYSEQEKHKANCEAFFAAMRDHIELLYPSVITSTSPTTAVITKDL